jgi:hypothetical protein
MNEFSGRFTVRLSENLTVKFINLLILRYFLKSQLAIDIHLFIKNK